MNNELGPIGKQATDILATILSSILIAAMIMYLIYLVISYIKTKNARKDYINKLNEHDKSIIKDYENLEWTPRKKNRK